MFARIQRLRSILRKPTKERSFSEKLLISGSITGTEMVIGILVKIGSTLILTRLLSPEVYGLFAVIMTFHMIIGMISDFGARQLILVSEEAEPPEFFQTCWTLQIIRGFGLFGIVFCLALGIYGLQQADFIAAESAYGAAELPMALGASGIMLLFMAGESVNMHVYAKQMRFAIPATISISYQLIYTSVSIMIAYYYPSIWALVIGGMVAGASRFFMSFTLLAGYHMKFCFHEKYTKDFVNHGKWILFQSVMTAITSQADRILLSIFLPSSTFGLYHLARQFYEIPIGLLNKLVGTFSIQFFVDAFKESKQNMQVRYYRNRILIDVVMCIFAGGFLTAGPVVIDLLYDPRYLETGFILQILGLGLPLLGMGIIRDAFAAKKQFKLSALFGTIQAISIWCGLMIVLVIFNDPIAAFAVISLYRIPDLIFMLTMAQRNGWSNALKEIRILPMIAVGALMGWGVSLAIEAMLK